MVKLLKNVNLNFQPKSKCALISSSEKLEIYRKPLHRNSLEMQRAYLVKQLTSFGGHRKIVLGNGSGNEKRVMKQHNEKLCLDDETGNRRTSNKCGMIYKLKYPTANCLYRISL